MFEGHPSAVMRGDLFVVLDAGAGEAGAEPTLDAIAAHARMLAAEVEAGARRRGTPTLMQCLRELEGLSGYATTHHALAALSTVRQRLKALGAVRARAFPGTLIEERTLVLPQGGFTSVVRVLPAASFEAWFVLTREVRRVTSAEAQGVILDAAPVDAVADSALAAPEVARVAVGYRLTRFGVDPEDLRVCMRVTQEPGAYAEAHAGGDGERVVVALREVVGVFDAAGHAELSGRLPGYENDDEVIEITGVALQGDVLGVNRRRPGSAEVELTLVSVSRRRGFPAAPVGEEAGTLIFGARRAYVIDGVELVGVPLFGAAREPRATLSLTPWFAEYPWPSRWIMAWDGERVWVSNGDKIIMCDAELTVVYGELVLPEPIMDLWVSDSGVRLVHGDPEAGRVRVAWWELGVEES